MRRKLGLLLCFFIVNTLCVPITVPEWYNRSWTIRQFMIFYYMSINQLYRTLHVMTIYSKSTQQQNVDHIIDHFSQKSKDYAQFASEWSTYQPSIINKCIVDEPLLNIIGITGIVGLSMYYLCSIKK